MPDNQPYYDDVEPGDEIGPVQRTPNRDQIRAYAAVGVGGSGGGGATQGGRFRSDEDARSEGLANMIVPGNMSMALLSQLLTDWAGPQGRLRKLEVNFRRMVNPDETISLSGLVIDKEEADGEGRVKIDVSIDNPRGEKPVVGTAVVVLPRKG